MKDRIKQLMESMHMNQQTFANHIHIGTATLSSILSGRTRPTLNTVEAIQQYCPKVNLGWLMNGLGDMYVQQDNTPSSSDNDIQSGSEVATRDLFSELDAAQQSDVTGGTSSPALPNNISAGSLSVQHGYGASNAPSGAMGSISGNTMKQPRVNRQQTATIGVELKNIDKYVRHITEIRVYYDDQTWETFVPKK